MHPLRVVHGIGVDLAAIHRFSAILTDADKTQRFLRKAFNPTEIDYFHSHVFRKPPRKHAEFLASRWAIKEATFKAFALARLDFREIAFHLDPVLPTPLPDVDVDPSPSIAAQALTDPQALEAALGPLPPLPLAGKRATLKFYGRAKRLMDQAGIDAEDCHVSISHELAYAVAYVLLQAKTVPSPPSPNTASSPSRST
jgi:phosphopantetheinyl transferase (holo-ACP synthase)